MRAVRAHNGAVTVHDVPAPSGDGVRVRVRAAGICGSDLHLLAADGLVPPERTLGHEIAGVTDDHDLAIGLDYEASDVVISGKMRDNSSVASAESGIQRAVGIVPAKQEVIIAAVVNVAGNHDFAVVLKSNRIGFINNTVVRGDNSVSGACFGKRRIIIHRGYI